MINLDNKNDYLAQELLEPKNIVIYEKWIDENDNNLNKQRLYQKICLLTENKNQYHKYCGFNKFTQETFPIPSREDGWVDSLEDNEDGVDDSVDDKIKRIQKRIKCSICDPAAKIFSPLDSDCDISTKYSNYSVYKTLDNYEIGFVVYISEDYKEVNIYGRTEDVIVEDYEDESITFVKQIIKYEPLEIFIGTSPENKMTLFSEGHGEKWDGNSILLRIGDLNEFRYVHIGASIFEFTTNEKITKYMSSVGNNCVPYPYAESLNFCYSMLEKNTSPISQHEDREDTGYIDYVDNATYENMLVTKISGRNSYNVKYEASCSEKTNVVRFKQSGQFRLMENTCSDNNLPLVQQVNNNLN